MVSGPNLSPERFAELPHWGLVAFAARCGFRVLPAARYSPSPREEAIDSLRTAAACCLIPMYSALSAGGQYQSSASKAAEIRYRDKNDGVVRVASQHLSVVAESVAPGTVERAAGVGAEVVRSYGEIASRYGARDEFDEAASADLFELEGYRLEPEAAVPREFFARPLFSGQDGLPPAWQSVLDEWRALLGTLGLIDLFDFYEGMRVGGRTTLAEIASIIDAWERVDVRVAPPGVAPVPLWSAAALGGEKPAAAVVLETAAAPPPAPPDVPSAPTERPPLFMLADHPLEGDFEKQDLLGSREYAESLAVILDGIVEPPFTMSINAPWGAGKTSLANMIEHRLRQLPLDRGDAPHVIFWFNAWMHDDAPNLATALISEVSRQADTHRPRRYQLVEPLPAALLAPSARRWRRASYGGVAIVLTLLSSWWVGEHLQHVEERKRYEARLRETYQETQTTTTDASATITSFSNARTATRTQDKPAPAGAPPPVHAEDGALVWLQERTVVLGTFFTAGAGLIGLLVKVLSSTSLLGFVQAPDKAAEAGTIHAARKQIWRLIDQATSEGNRFIVFVDDIERCKPPRAVDVLDAINQLLDHPKVIVVLLGDMAAVAAAAQLKYKDLAEIYVPSADLVPLGLERRKEVFGLLYIQKIVQFQFDLPPLPRRKIQSYVDKLLGATDDAGTSHAGPAA